MSTMIAVLTVLWLVLTNSVILSQIQVRIVQQTQPANILSHIITVYAYVKFTPTINIVLLDWFTGVNVTCPELELLPVGSECLL